MNQAQKELASCRQAIKDGHYFLDLAQQQVDAVDPEDRDSGNPAVNLADARSELANASNSIDDAMGLIDKLTAPEPTVWDDPHLP